MNESTRNIVLRVVLGVATIMFGFWGLANLFFTKAQFNATAPSGETYTDYNRLLLMLLGLSSLTWAVAFAIAFRAPLKNPGFLLAITITIGLWLVVGSYLNLVVAPRVEAMSVVSDILLLLMFILILVFYPRGQKAT